MRNQSWVVYTMPLRDDPDTIRAVCDQTEWETMDRAKPGFFALVRGGIPTEGEAEQLARRSAWEAKPQKPKAGPPSWLDKADALLASARVSAG